MSPRPHHTKKDANQAGIVRDLRDLGFLVIEVADLPGNDNPVIGHPLDLFVGGLRITLDGDWYAWVQVEDKMPGGELDDREQAYFDYWPSLPIIKAECAEDILRWFGRCE